VSGKAGSTFVNFGFSGAGALGFSFSGAWEKAGDTSAAAKAAARKAESVFMTGEKQM
jgi:hypothetical protein